MKKNCPTPTHVSSSSRRNGNPSRVREGGGGGRSGAPASSFDD